MGYMTTMHKTLVHAEREQCSLLTCRSLGFCRMDLPPLRFSKALVNRFPPWEAPGPNRSGTQALMCGKLRVSLFSDGTS
jgi:hypothetical protein